MVALRSEFCDAMHHAWVRPMAGRGTRSPSQEDDLWMDPYIASLVRKLQAEVRCERIETARKRARIRGMNGTAIQWQVPVRDDPITQDRAIALGSINNSRGTGDRGTKADGHHSLLVSFRLKFIFLS